MDALLKNKIENELQHKRSSAQMLAAQRLDSLYKKHPCLKQAELKKRSLISDLSLSKDEKQARIAAAQAEIDAYLAQNGLTVPVPVYSCPLCSDTGYTVDPDGSKVRCACFKKRIIEESFKDSFCPPCGTFDAFNENIFDENVRKDMLAVKERCLEFCTRFPSVKHPNLILCGDTGTGKTFLLSAVNGKLRERGFSTVFITAGRLFDILRKYAFGKSDDIDTLLSADVLLIDDMGTEPVFNNITLEYTFMLVNERTLTKKSMCISTNLNPDQFKERYTERIASRVFDRSTSTVFRLRGNDLRFRRPPC